MRVLFVEDNQQVAETVSLALKSRGHRCRCLMRGAPAVPLAKDQDFDIVVLDIDLPDVNGCEVLDRMRAEGVNTPVLLQSGLPDSRIPEEGMSLGDDFLYKPFSIDQLIQRMESAIEKGKKSRELLESALVSEPPAPADQADGSEPQAAPQVSNFALPPLSVAQPEPVDVPPEAAPSEADPPEAAPAQAAQPEAVPLEAVPPEPAPPEAASVQEEIADEVSGTAEEEKSGADRRRHERHDTFEAAVITDSGRHIACAIRNVSESGAALRLSDASIELPDVFSLRQLDGPEWRCQLRWRDVDRVGVEFLL